MAELTTDLIVQEQTYKARTYGVSSIYGEIQIEKEVAV